MRIGLIARCDFTGLGIQSKEFFDHIPCKALVIDFSAMAPPLKDILNPNLDWYPGQTVFKWGSTHNTRGDIPREVISEFIKDIDILFAMETPYDYNIFEMCRERGVKTILQLNYEFLDFPSFLPPPDLFLAPSLWHYNDIPEPKKYVPVPVNTKRFDFPGLNQNTFMHVLGRQAAYDRNGTEILLRSLRYVKNNITLRIKTQMPLQVSKAIIPSNVDLFLDYSNKKNYSENYFHGGVMVMPRRYGGLCLPFHEAIAAHMPVITTNISPNNSWLPEEWLVPANHEHSFNAKKRIEVFQADPIALAEKIDQFCDKEFYSNAVARAAEIKKIISWETLLPDYYETFKEVLK